MKFPVFPLSFRLLPTPARLLCGESRQSNWIQGWDSITEPALTALDASGSSRLVDSFFHVTTSLLGNVVCLCSHPRPMWFILSSEGRQGTAVVSCYRMVPAGFPHVCPQRVLSDTVRVIHCILFSPI